MLLVEKKGLVVLQAEGRTYHPDDMTSHGKLARDLPALQSHELFPRFRDSPRRRSRGRPKSNKPLLVNVWARVPIVLKARLRAEADAKGLTLSRYVAELVADAAGYEDEEWRPE